MLKEGWMLLKTEFVKLGKVYKHLILNANSHTYCAWKCLWIIVFSVESNSSIVCRLFHFSSEIVALYPCMTGWTVGCRNAASMLFDFCCCFAICIAKVRKFSDICKYLCKNLTITHRISSSCAFVLPNAHGNFHYVNVRFYFISSTAVALSFFHFVCLCTLFFSSSKSLVSSLFTCHNVLITVGQIKGTINWT